MYTFETQKTYNNSNDAVCLLQEELIIGDRSMLIKVNDGDRVRVSTFHFRNKEQIKSIIKSLNKLL